MTAHERFAAGGQAVPLITRPAAMGLLIGDTITGQSGTALAYTTKLGTPAQLRFVHFGVDNNDYDAGLLFTPSLMDRSVETPIVPWIHGSTANEQQVLEGGRYHKGAQSLLDDWLDRGWVVVSLRAGTTGVVDYTQSRPQWVSSTVYQTNDIVQDVGANATGLGPLYRLLAGPYSSTKRPASDGAHWQYDNDDGKWGNQPFRLGAKGLWAWANSWMTPHSNGLLVCGFSAGGAFSPNLLVEAKRGTAVPIAAMATIDGACNLRDTWTNLSTSRGKIGPAYGLTSTSAGHVGSADWIAKIDSVDGGHDMGLVPLGSSVFPQCPILLSASPDDTTVDWVANAQMFRDRLLAAGWDTAGVTGPKLTFVQTAGGHGNTNHFDAATISPFFVAALA